MDIAQKTLKSLQKKDILLDVYTDHFNESLYGFVRDFNDEFLLLEHYNDDGLYNGIIILRRQDITRIRWDNNDINSISKILQRHEHIEQLADINIDSIENILNSVNKAFNHINIKIQNIEPDWSIIGQVQDMDKKTIIIKEFGTMKSLDRATLMLSISDITRIDAGGIYENNLLKIHNINNKC
jgi:hypothetical protein